MNYCEDELFPHISRLRTPVMELPVGGAQYQNLPVPFMGEPLSQPIQVAEPTIEDIARATNAKEEARNRGAQMEGFFVGTPGFSFYKKNGSYVLEIPETFIYIFLMFLILLLMMQIFINNKRKVIIIEKDSNGKETVREVST